MVRWRLIDLAQCIFEEFRITIAKQTLSRELGSMGYRKLSARPRHHAQAAGAIEDFKKASPPRTAGIAGCTGPRSTLPPPLVAASNLNQRRLAGGIMTSRYQHVADTVLLKATDAVADETAKLTVCGAASCFPCLRKWAVPLTSQHR